MRLSCGHQPRGPTRGRPRGEAEGDRVLHTARHGTDGGRGLVPWEGVASVSARLPPYAWAWGRAPWASVSSSVKWAPVTQSTRSEGVFHPASRALLFTCNGARACPAG